MDFQELVVLLGGCLTNEELVGVTSSKKTCVSVVVPSHSLTPSSSTLGIEKQLNYFNTFHRLPQLRKSSVGLI